MAPRARSSTRSPPDLGPRAGDGPPPFRSRLGPIMGKRTRKTLAPGETARTSSSTEDHVIEKVGTVHRSIELIPRHGLGRTRDRKTAISLPRVRFLEKPDP